MLQTFYMQVIFATQSWNIHRFKLLVELVESLCHSLTQRLLSLSVTVVSNKHVEIVSKSL